MAKRCFGITKQFKRCTNERMLIPVCSKHVWQFIQLLVFILTFGAIVATLELYHIYEAHLNVMQQGENTSIDNAEDTASDQMSEDQYKEWVNSK